MTIRIIDLDQEYDLLSLWWTKRHLAPPPKIVLRGAIGFTVGAGVDIAMGWVYVSQTVGFLEWVTTNPSVASSATTVQALIALLGFAEECAKKHGANVLACGTQDEGSLARFMESYGWQKCEGKPHQFLIKALP